MSTTATPRPARRTRRALGHLVGIILLVLFAFAAVAGVVNLVDGGKHAVCAAKANTLSQLNSCGLSGINGN
ncbi:MAG TPA: hypothetical protein VMF07_16815 [Solirubrobacteraceae bacterium]|nr:hypothetical protein [Solirubrobacteraceae bacterium]